MPVAKGPSITPRSALIVGASAVVAAIILGAFVMWVARSNDRVEVRLGDEAFEDLDAERISAEIADRGPIFFPDLVGDELPIWLVHIGDDPETGWLALEARLPDRPDCLVEWDPQTGRFVPACDDDRTFAVTGEGLASLPVIVDDGKVTVDINRILETTTSENE